MLFCDAWLQDSSSAEEFMQQLPQYDQDLAKQRHEAEATEEVRNFKLSS